MSLALGLAVVNNMLLLPMAKVKIVHVQTVLFLYEPFFLHSRIHPLLQSCCSDAVF